jgi:hypothetical protein
MLIAELFESTNENVLVIYPGRFQPFHKGHKAVYDGLAKKYGRDRVFIATSNKVEPPKSPFSFSDKAQFMALTGVHMDRVIESSQPYRAIEIVSRYDAASTRLIFAVSEKDMAEDPRFASWTKKDGTPAYFQPMPSDTGMMQTLDKHAYIVTVPTVQFTVMGQPMTSATEVRSKFIAADPKTQKAIVMDLFGGYNDAVLHIMQQKLSGTAT